MTGPQDALPTPETTELLPCPCCAGTLALHENDWAEPPLWSAWCRDCGLHFAEKATREAATVVANRRPLGSASVDTRSSSTPREKEMREALEEVRRDLLNFQEGSGTPDTLSAIQRIDAALAGTPPSQ